MKKRFHSFDILKCIAIFSVCFYHFSNIPSGISGGFSVSVLTNRYFFTLNSICVPMFMMVNGALLLNRPLNVKKHYRNLLIFFAVFAVWRVITFVVLGVASGYDFSAYTLPQLVSRFVLLLDFGYPLMVDHLWFIASFIRIQLLLPFFRYMFSCEEKDFRIIATVTMAVLWVSCIGVKDFSILQSAFPALLGDFYVETVASYAPFSGIFGTMVFFFLLGSILVKYSDSFKKIPALLFPVGFLGSAAVQVIIFALGYINSGDASDLVFGRYNTTTNLVMCLCPFFEKQSRLFRPFEVVGQHTISIFYLHWIIGRTVVDSLDLPAGYIPSIIAVVLLVAVCTVVSVVGRKVPVANYLFGYISPVKEKVRQ